jgi:hypothetical protein
MDDTSAAPTCVRWENLLSKMKKQGVPFSLRELAVNGKDLLALGLPPQSIARILQALLMHTALTPADNKKEKLCALALKMDAPGMR